MALKKSVKAALVVVPVIGIAIAIGISQWPGDPDPDPDNDGASNSKFTAINLIEIKHQGVAQLENNRFDKAAATFEKLIELLPKTFKGELVGVRNLCIARLLAAGPHSIDKFRDPVKFADALILAEKAMGQLEAIDGESAVTLLLAARLAQITADPAAFDADPNITRQVDQLVQAGKLEQDNASLWCELYIATQHSDSDALLAQSKDALQRAFELKPKNLFLLCELLRLQIKNKDPRLVESLKIATQALRPFAESMRRHGNGFDVMSQIESAIKSIEANDWAGATGAVLYTCNLMAPEVARQIDHRRVQLHELEYVVHEFSDEFYESAILPVTDHPAAIPVKFSIADDKWQLPKLKNVRDTILVDFDMDGRIDVIVVTDHRVEIYSANSDPVGWNLITSFESPIEISHVLAFDLDRDLLENVEPRSKADEPETDVDRCANADVDLIIYGESGILLLENRFETETQKRTLARVGQNNDFKSLTEILSVVVADLDHDGDLDFVASTKNGLSLWSNYENWQFVNISGNSTMPPDNFKPVKMFAVDWNRDLDIDILLADPQSSKVGYLENILHSRFRWQEFDANFEIEQTRAMAIADVDVNLSWDLITIGKDGLTLTSTIDVAYGVMKASKTTRIAQTAHSGLQAWDYDNDGFEDLLTWGSLGLEVYRGSAHGKFERVKGIIDGHDRVDGRLSHPLQVLDCEIGDIDNDGDLDLLVRMHIDLGVIILMNEGGNQNHWIDVVVRGDPSPDAQKPDLRVNVHCIGSLAELKSGSIYQAKPVTGQTTHFGLGKGDQIDVLRVILTNGVPQSLLQPSTNQPICVQQYLKGSCPYIYTWTGSEYAFFTDCLWAAPIGLQFAEGVLAKPREWEYLKIPGNKLTAHNGEYRIQITEELWEAAYFDLVRLLAVDHPEDVEIYSNEKVGPAEIAEFKIHTVRRPRLPISAHDQRGRDVLPLLSSRDDKYLKAFDQRLRQGLTPEHFIELDLGKLLNPKQITLFLTGWIFPTDTSINIALSQNAELAGPSPPSVWVPDKTGEWRQVKPNMGFPGGKTKTIAIDLSDVFPSDDYRVRIVTTMEIYWDAAFFTVDEKKSEYRIAEMPLLSADLHFRGFSQRVPHAQFGPEHYNYREVDRGPRWPPMSGNLTRFGDITELLRTADDRIAVLGSGDEMTVRFKVVNPQLPPGWKRDFILHNVGWDKDADLNTVYGQTIEPLPFRSMGQYPYTAEREFPNTPAHRDYLKRYQTRTQQRRRFWSYVRDFGTDANDK